jgi:transketolase
VRVVSLPVWELFEEQSAEYRESVLPKAVGKRLVVEAGASLVGSAMRAMQAQSWVSIASVRRLRAMFA